MVVASTGARAHSQGLAAAGAVGHKLCPRLRFGLAFFHRSNVSFRAPRVEYGFRSRRPDDEDDEDDAESPEFHSRNSGRPARTTGPLKERVRIDPIGIDAHGLETTGPNGQRLGRKPASSTIEVGSACCRSGGRQGPFARPLGRDLATIERTADCNARREFSPKALR